MLDLTAVAAFAAAGLSLVNVVVTAQLASRLHLQQWRRDEVRPVVERILVCAREAQKAWTSAAVSRELLRIAPDQATDCQETVKEQWDKGKAAWDQLSSEIARLDLVAAEPVRKAAEALQAQLEGMGLRIRPSRDCLYPLRALEVDIYQLMMDLTAEARSEIGLERETIGQRIRSLVHWPRRAHLTPATLSDD